VATRGPCRRTGRDTDVGRSMGFYPLAHRLATARQRRMLPGSHWTAGAQTRRCDTRGGHQTSRLSNGTCHMGSEHPASPHLSDLSFLSQTLRQHLPCRRCRCHRRRRRSGFDFGSLVPPSLHPWSVRLRSGWIFVARAVITVCTVQYSTVQHRRAPTWVHRIRISYLS